MGRESRDEEKVASSLTCYSFAGAGNVDERRYISTFTSVLGKDGHCLC